MESNEHTATAEPLAIEHDEIGAFALDVAPAIPAHPLAGDDEITADLAAIGITLAPDTEATLDVPRLQAVASLCFRRAQRRTRRIGELRAACELEVAAVTASYEREIAPLASMVTRLLAHVETIARLIPWSKLGKKKSFDTPYGSYGVRKQADTVEQADAAALEAWAVAERPDLVKITVTLSLAEAREYFSEEELAAKGKRSVAWGTLKGELSKADPADGALPPGVRAVPGGDEPFVKPASVGGEG